MKTLITGIILIIVLLFTAVENYAKKGIDGKLLGVWRLTEIIDSRTKESSPQRAVVTYHFHGDGTVFSTNTLTRERLKWAWRAKRGFLQMKSKTTPHYLQGSYRFKDEDTVHYHVKMGKKRYIWVFERY